MIPAHRFWFVAAALTIGIPVLVSACMWTRGGDVADHASLRFQDLTPQEYKKELTRIADKYRTLENKQGMLRKAFEDLSDELALVRAAGLTQSPLLVVPLRSIAESCVGR